MEDAHSFVVDYDNIRGQGFFAVFDGHAGKHAAEWCGNHFHEVRLRCCPSFEFHSPSHQYLLETIHAAPDTPIPDILNSTFHSVDESLSKMCEESDGKIHSGCTAVTAVLRVEDAAGHQSFLTQPSASEDTPASAVSEPFGAPPSPPDSGNEADGDKENKKEKPSSKIKKALKSLGPASKSGAISSKQSSQPPSDTPSKQNSVGEVRKVHIPPPDSRRVLYCANAGDARGVLCRSAKAVRLTYDHKGSDKQEAKRITDAGGFVMSGRVNGVLAVTRSLGDSSMKEFVVGAPYTTETELCEEDEFVILACDGVCALLLHPPRIHNLFPQLWDVISDQAAVDLIRGVEDAQRASSELLRYAISHHTTDNVTVLVVRFKHLFPKTA